MTETNANACGGRSEDVAPDQYSGRGSAMKEERREAAWCAVYAAFGPIPQMHYAQVDDFYA
jgi:hypothetical protein